MKKLFILSVVAVGFCSFTTKKQEVTQRLYSVQCKANGEKYYFTCDCRLEHAQYVGHSICQASNK